jgi:hypothetical protein
MYLECSFLLWSWGLANNQRSGSPRILTDAISREMVAIKAHVNVAQEYIVITEDRAYRCLQSWKESIESRNRWIAPVTLTASLALTFFTSTFKDTWGISQYTWQSFFAIVLAFSAAWSLFEIIVLLRKAVTGQATGSVDELISQMKKGAAVVSEQLDESALQTKVISTSPGP